MTLRQMLSLLGLACAASTSPAQAGTAFDAILFRTGFDAYVCPNGTTEDTETCDDGGATPGDGCSDRCQVEFGYYCGGAPAVCVTLCGDGAPAGSEACDDGDVLDGDGCSAQCLVEPDFQCSGVPSVCTALCVATTGTPDNDSLVGTAVDDCLSGLGGDDLLQGNGGNDTLDGGPGNDTLDGGPGGDTMAGGDGNDGYVVDAAGDLVTETSPTGGVDTVQATINQVLGANVENLSLGGVGNLAGSGNELPNLITGNGADNFLQGLGGDDLLQGDAGSDSLNGGPGNDTLDGGSGNDTLVGGDGDDLYIVSGVGDVVSETSLFSIDTVQAAISYTLGGNLENLSLAGAAGINGTGNTLPNLITGNAAANALSGQGGNDTLVGGPSFDTLTGGAGADRFVIDSIVPSDNDRVTDFLAGTDEMAFDMSVLGIGNGDTIVTGAATPGTWAPTLELVIDTSPLSALDTATIGAEFSSASAAIPANARIILVARSSSPALPGTGIYLFVSDGDDDVEAAELTTLAVLLTAFPDAVDDFVFVP